MRKELDQPRLRDSMPWHHAEQHWSPEHSSKAKHEDSMRAERRACLSPTAPAYGLEQSVENSEGSAKELERMEKTAIGGSTCRSASSTPVGAHASFFPDTSSSANDDSVNDERQNSGASQTSSGGYSSAANVSASWSCLAQAPQQKRGELVRPPLPLPIRKTTQPPVPPKSLCADDESAWDGSSVGGGDEGGRGSDDATTVLATSESGGGASSSTHVSSCASAWRPSDLETGSMGSSTCNGSSGNTGSQQSSNSNDTTTSSSSSSGKRRKLKTKKFRKLSLEISLLSSSLMPLTPSSLLRRAVFPSPTVSGGTSAPASMSPHRCSDNDNEQADSGSNSATGNSGGGLNPRVRRRSWCRRGAFPGQNDGGRDCLRGGGTESPAAMCGGDVGSRRPQGDDMWWLQEEFLAQDLQKRLMKLSRIGKGASSSVFKAVDLETLQLVALKEVEVCGSERRAIISRELTALAVQSSSKLGGQFQSALCGRMHSYMDGSGSGSGSGSGGDGEDGARQRRQRSVSSTGTAFGNSFGEEEEEKDVEHAAARSWALQQQRRQQLQQRQQQRQQNMEEGSNGGAIRSPITMSLCPHIVEFYGAMKIDKDTSTASDYLWGGADDTTADSRRQQLRQQEQRQQLNQHHPPSVVAIAVEFIGGGSLQNWVTHGVPISERWLASMAFQCLTALKFLGDIDIIHRDIKPANILITTSGDVKLADFGMAISRKDVAQTHFAGTRRYMSPEMLRTLKASAQSDLWALGLTLAAAALGECPVQQMNDEFSQVLAGEDAPTSLQAHPGFAALDQDLQALLTAMLHPKPKERPTAQELLAHAPFLKRRWEWAGTVGDEATAVLDVQTETLRLELKMNAPTSTATFSASSSSSKLLDGAMAAQLNQLAMTGAGDVSDGDERRRGSRERRDSKDGKWKGGGSGGMSAKVRSFNHLPSLSQALSRGTSGNTSFGANNNSNLNLNSQSGPALNNTSTNFHYDEDDLMMTTGMRTGSGYSKSTSGGVAGFERHNSFPHQHQQQHHHRRRHSRQHQPPLHHSQNLLSHSNSGNSIAANVANPSHKSYLTYFTSTSSSGAGGGGGPGLGGGAGASLEAGGPAMQGAGNVGEEVLSIIRNLVKRRCDIGMDGPLTSSVQAGPFAADLGISEKKFRILYGIFLDDRTRRQSFQQVLEHEFAGTEGTPLGECRTPSRELKDAAATVGLAARQLPDNLLLIAKIMKHQISTKDRRTMLGVSRKSFVGHDAVRWMESAGLALNSAEGVRMGQRMMDLGLIYNAEGSGNSGSGFKDASGARYQWADTVEDDDEDGMANIFNLAHASDRQRRPTGSSSRGNSSNLRVGHSSRNHSNNSSRGSMGKSFNRNSRDGGIAAAGNGETGDSIKLTNDSCTSQDSTVNPQLHDVDDRSAPKDASTSQRRPRRRRDLSFKGFDIICNNLTPLGSNSQSSSRESGYCCSNASASMGGGSMFGGTPTPTTATAATAAAHLFGRFYFRGETPTSSAPGSVERREGGDHIECESPSSVGPMTRDFSFCLAASDITSSSGTASPSILTAPTSNTASSTKSMSPNPTGNGRVSARRLLRNRPVRRERVGQWGEEYVAEDSHDSHGEQQGGEDDGEGVEGGGCDDDEVTVAHGDGNNAVGGDVCMDGEYNDEGSATSSAFHFSGPVRHGSGSAKLNRSSDAADSLGAAQQPSRHAHAASRHNSGSGAINNTHANTSHNGRHLRDAHFFSFDQSDENSVRAVALQLRQNIALKSRWIGVHRFPYTFLGTEATQWLIDFGHAENVKKAVDLGNEMMNAGFICHVTSSFEFSNSSLCYTFVMRDDDEGDGVGVTSASYQLRHYNSTHAHGSQSSQLQNGCNDVASSACRRVNKLGSWLKTTGGHLRLGKLAEKGGSGGLILGKRGGALRRRAVREGCFSDNDDDDDQCSQDNATITSNATMATTSSSTTKNNSNNNNTETHRQSRRRRHGFSIMNGHSKEKYVSNTTTTNNNKDSNVTVTEHSSDTSSAAPTRTASGTNSLADSGSGTGSAVSGKSLESVSVMGKEADRARAPSAS